MSKLETSRDGNGSKGKRKQKLAKLTDLDLRFAADRDKEFLGRIQECTGETRDAIEKAVKEVVVWRD